MPEVLRGHSQSATAHTLKVPDGVLDAVTEQLLARRSAAAEQRGWQAGYDEGRRAATEHLGSLTAGIEQRLDALVDELRAQRAEATRCHLDIATQLADAVLARTPPDDAAIVLQRIEEAVALIDDELTVRLHPDDATALSGQLGDLIIVADTTVARGEVHLQGPEAGATITRATLLQAAAAAVADAAFTNQDSAT